MLNTSKIGLVQTLLQDAYCSRVSVRKGLKKWTLPNRWKNEIAKVAAYLIERRIDSSSSISSYVDSQFVFWNPQRCSSLFKMNYPPLPILRNNRSLYRYERNEQNTRKPVEETIVDLKRAVTLEISTMKQVPDPDITAFCILSGQLRYTTLAYMVLCSIVDEAYAVKVLDTINEARPGAYDEYNNAVPKARKIKGGTDGATNEGNVSGEIRPDVSDEGENAGGVDYIDPDR